jgi:AraC-like DNA-binding protein
MKYLHEKILTGPGQSFTTHDELGRVIDCTFHVHPEYEIIYIESSFGTRFIGDNISMFNAGDLALIGPMVPHHYYNLPEDSTSSEWGHARVIQFREDFANKFLFDVPEMDSVKKMLEASSFGIEFPADAVVEAYPLVKKLFTVTGPSRITLLLELWSLLSSSDYRKLSTISGKNTDSYGQDHRMNKILRYMHDCLGKGKSLSLDKVAAKANMNPQAFSRYFRKTTFKRFIDYINEVKIGKACRTLIDTDQTIAETCFNSGFNNLSNFNRQFMKLKSMTPKEFRSNFNRHNI